MEYKITCQHCSHQTHTHYSCQELEEHQLTADQQRKAWKPRGERELLLYQAKQDRLNQEHSEAFEQLQQFAEAQRVKQ